MRSVADICARVAGICARVAGEICSSFLGRARFFLFRAVLGLKPLPDPCAKLLFEAGPNERAKAA